MKIIICLLFVSIVNAQEQTGPVITTNNGNLRVASQGDITFQAGEGGGIQFQSASGENMAIGEQGPKGEKGDQGVMGLQGTAGTNGADGTPGFPGAPGPLGEKGKMGDQGVQGEKGDLGAMGAQGQQGLRGVSATDSALISWNECTWLNLNSGIDYGQIAMCALNKIRNDTWLRITWGGNMRIVSPRRPNSCMRWYFTVNGEECLDPGAIDAVIFVGGTNLHILRQSTISGSCRATDSNGVSSVIGAGAVRVQFLVQDCPGFGGQLYDAYTGFNSVSRITIEEIIPRDDTYAEVIAMPPEDFIYTPNYCQYFFPNLGGNRERNVGGIAVAKFTKEHPHTVLRVTWEGNLRKRACNSCCTRWWIEIDGSECSSYEKIETSIISSTAQDIFAPTTISGLCVESGDLPISDGEHQIRLQVGPCDGSRLITNTASGFFSTSRLIVEEIPTPRDPEVLPDYYHPQWTHCAVNSDDIDDSSKDIDEGPIPEISCTHNKTSDTSSLRVSFNGNIQLSDCVDCCMRWFVTLNGEECTDPAPIDAVVFASDVQRFSLHRGSTITGICSGTGNGALLSGDVEAVLNVGPCAGSNDTFDAHTGEDAPFAITLEELPQPVNPAPTNGYYPIWTQCATDEPLNTMRNATDNSTDEEPLQTCTFTKQNANTTLRVAWDGNIALNDCNECCMRWYITIDGEECANPGPVDGALVQNTVGTAYDLGRPASIVGICRGIAGEELLEAGEHSVEVLVGPCRVTDEGSVAAVPERAATTTGYNSVSRFIVEEIPDSTECEDAYIP